MTAVLATPPFLQFCDEDGNPLAGYELHTFAAGTLNRKATYTDQSATVEMTNPIILDSAGRTTFWITGAYKYIFTEPDGDISDPIKVTDNVTNFNTLADAVDPLFDEFDGDGATTVFTLSENVGTDSENLLLFIDNKSPEYITNGTFAADSEWTKGTGWVIGTGVATATTASTALSQTVDIVSIVEGESYTITYTITRSAGDVTVSIGGTDGTTRSAAGTYTETIIAGSTQVVAFTGNGFTGTIDNVSLKSIYAKGFDVINPSLYSVNGTSLTFANAPLDGSKVYVFAPSLLLGAASAAAAAAASSETNAAASEALAEQWATLITGLVDATDYSSKAWAIGGIGVTDGDGASKEWATRTDDTVDGSEYSAKAYAQSDLTGATGGSAKDWAITAEDSIVTGSEYSAKHYAAKASASATESATQATKLTGTSTTSVTIGTGTKAFTTQSGKDFNGNNVRVYSDADPTNYMDGLATYSGTSLSVEVVVTGGSGTFADWTIKVNGARGATGAAGSVTDGDKGDIVVSSSGTVWKLDDDAISGQTETTALATDNFVLERSGILYRDTIQGITDVTTGQLFGGSTVTPDGTELVAFDDGTNATTQSIADLAGGGATAILLDVNVTNVSSIDITSKLDDTVYSSYRLSWVDAIGASAGWLGIRLSIDNGVNFISGASSYVSRVENFEADSASARTITTNTDDLIYLGELLTASNTANSGFSNIVITNGAGTAASTFVETLSQNVINDFTNIIAEDLANIGGIANAIQIIGDGFNITGRFTLIGYKK